jgi:RNA polymerase sigma-70 factor (ECF subfamily)
LIAVTSEAAFEQFVGPHRAQLHAHCYRMLGSVHDADDAMQDAMLRAWRGMDRFEGRSSAKSWLYRIATNACLDLIGRRPKRELAIDGGPPSDPHEGPGPPLTETAWIEPYPDVGLEYEQRESVELAFIAALQHLPALQRAALIMREVLGFSAKETADALDTTPAAINSALQRARKAVDEKRPEQTQQETLGALSDTDLRELVEVYADAWEHGDVDTIVAKLSDDATIAMPPMATWFRGRDAVAVFLRDWAFAHPWQEGEAAFRGDAGERSVRLIPTTANGQLAYASYRWDPALGAHVPMAMQVLTLNADRTIADITGFVMPSVFRYFGLPEELPSTASHPR